MGGPVFLPGGQLSSCAAPVIVSDLQACLSPAELGNSSTIHTDIQEIQTVACQLLKSVSDNRTCEVNSGGGKLPRL